MTDDHEWVRRLLAETGRAPEPMPGDIADRIDAALAELAESDAPVPAVVPMTRRRHRRWGGALLAAAALTVGGYSLTATGILDDLTGGGQDASSAESAADAGADALAPEQAPADAGSRPSARDSDSLMTGPVPALGSSTLQRDAAELVRETGLAALAEGSLSAGGGSDAAEDSAGSADSADERGQVRETRGCVQPPTGGAGTRVRVTYEGDPATAVVQPRAGGGTRVQVWSCTESSRLASVVVPDSR